MLWILSRSASWRSATHYENTHIQIYWLPTENFQIKTSDILHISAQKLDCGRGGSNEYPQSMFFEQKYEKYVFVMCIFLLV